MLICSVPSKKVRLGPGDRCEEKFYTGKNNSGYVVIGSRDQDMHIYL